jgi:hypothetical protein
LTLLQAKIKYWKEEANEEMQGEFEVTNDRLKRLRRQAN